MNRDKREYNEFLSIAVDSHHDDNGTLQDPGDDVDLEFTIKTYAGVPAGIETQGALREHLAKVFQQFTALGLEVAFEIQISERDKDSIYN